MAGSDPAVEAEVEKYVGREVGPPEVGRDPVNEPMIRHWCEAMDDRNPVYTDGDAAAASVHGGIVAPPVMMQAWILKGFEMALDTEPSDLQEELHAVFNKHGYTGVVATNCDQGITRYLRPGDQVKAAMTIESISEQKSTAMGLGYFVETKTTFLDRNDEEVGWMTFRVLKFKPGEAQQAAAAGNDEGGAAPPKPGRIRPPLNQDVAWWWEGIDGGHLLIQKCSDCGELRHPPRPVCGKCMSMEWGSVASTGLGTVHSYVILHHPPMPGYEMPAPIVLVDLEEGTRLVSSIAGCRNDEIVIGMKVECRIEEVDEGFKIPVFYPIS